MSTVTARRGATGGAVAVWRAELARLSAQPWTRVALALCAVAPFLAVGVLAAQSSVPEDTLFGRWVHTSGFALPLVVLSFAGQWGLPALATLVAGDIFSAEDHHGTWKAVLTRSRSRSEVFVGKTAAALTWSVLVVVVLALASTAAGLLAGTEPLVGLSGQLVPAGQAVPLVLASWATALAPTLGFAAVGLAVSVVTRRSTAGIGVPVLLGLLMQLLALVNGPDLLRVLLLSTAYGSWHGLWAQPTFTGPLLQGLAVSAVWLVLGIVVAHQVFLRRDVAVS